jgi:hypothetical protein
LPAQADDCQWHRQWSQALVKMAVEDTPTNRDVIQEWIGQWYGRSRRAVEAFSPIFDSKWEEAKIEPFQNMLQQIDSHFGEYYGHSRLNRRLHQRDRFGAKIAAST